MAEHSSSGMAHAYIMVTVDPAQTRKVVERLRAIPGSYVHEVLGPFDIIVELEVEAPEYITSTLREKIRPVPGVLSTVTCTWIEE